MNAYPYIKNIDHEKVLKIADQVNADADQVVSKTLAQNDFVSVTLFAFSKGEDISTHDSIGDAMVTVIEGCGKFIVDDKEYIVNQGESLVMPAKKPHSVHAVEAFKMMLVRIQVTKISLPIQATAEDLTDQRTRIKTKVRIVQQTATKMQMMSIN